MAHEYEDALWNNSFYSLASTISLLLLLNHILTLKKTVNIPNSVLTQLVSAGLLDAGEVARIEKPKINRTLLMRVSPSMKALESVLNEKPDISALSNSQTILEEEEPQLDLWACPDAQKENRHPQEDVYPAPTVLSGQIAPGAAKFDAPKDIRPVGLTRAWPKTRNSVYIAPEDQRQHAHSTVSVQTFHTARLTDSVGSDQNQENITPKLAQDEAASISTAGDTTPRPTQDDTLQKTRPEEILEESGEENETILGKPEDLEETDDIPPRSVERMAQTASRNGSAPLLPEKTTKMQPPAPATEYKSMLVGDTPPPPIAKSPAMKSAQIRRETKTDETPLAEPAMTTYSRPVQLHFPVKSMLDSPKLDQAFQAEQKREDATPKPATATKMVSNSSSETLKTKLKDVSSAFATPRSHISEPQTPLPLQKPQRRSNTLNNLAGTANGGATSQNGNLPSSASKRFSFRGMFKIKLKNHSLDKLSGVQEEIEPSKPAKITLKSFSTPNFADFAKDKKKDLRKSFFGKRRKSEVELQAFKVENIPEEESKPLPALKSEQVLSSYSAPKPQITVQPQKTVQPQQIVQIVPGQKAEIVPGTPATNYSEMSGSTPITANLHSNTIREVDDLDYLPVFDETIESPGFSQDQETPEVGDLPRRRSDGEFGEELSLEPFSSYLLRMPLDPKRALTMFGSPFAVDYSPSSDNFRSPRMTNLSEKTGKFNGNPETVENKKKSGSEDSDGLESRVELKKLVLPKPADNLFGDTLFPKLLNPHEVESIVSLERSRSMRSIKLNGKRSSFINYHGSDENIVLGSELAPQSEMRRLGSILKNSSSMKSLRIEPVLIDAAMELGEASNELTQENECDVSADTLKESETETVIEKTPKVREISGDYIPVENLDEVPVEISNGIPADVQAPQFALDESLHDFIEFTDFIDVDNLDFSSSPKQFMSRLVSPILAPEVVDYGDLQDLQDLDAKQQQVREEHAHPQTQKLAESPDPVSSVLPDPVAVQNPQPVPVLTRGTSAESVPDSPSSAPARALVSELTPESDPASVSPSVSAADNHSISSEDGPLPLSQEKVIVPVVPDVIVVNSASSLDFEHQIEPDTPNSPASDALALPILDQAYKLALEEAQARENPSTAARPVSMSFKGFSGSAFTTGNMVKHGSHQLVHLYNDSSNESSAVGQGFGSESEDESESEDDDEAYQSYQRQSNLNSQSGYQSHQSSHGQNYGQDYGQTYSQSQGYVGQGSTAPHASHASQSQKRKLMLGLQPPGPFHHDRIPSLSDHLAASSPRLLTSFISRIKKSPMASPKMTFKASVRFSSRIVLYDTYNGDEYDRHPDIATCNQLTPVLAQQIKDELNEVKAQMPVHRDSQCYTHFF